MIRLRIHLALAVAFVICLFGTGMAAEITGKVVEATATTARISTASDLVPNPGDAVEIYFEIPGLDETVSVASGKVRDAEGGTINVTIDKSSGKVAPDHLVRITSAAPKRSGAPPATTSLPPAGSTGTALVGPDAATRQLLPAVAKLLPERHFSRRLLDDQISRRWLANYLQDLDPLKSYFLKSDIDRFLTRRDELDDLCRQGDASVAYDILRVYLARLDERTALVRELVAESHDFTLPEEWINDFEAAKYASSDAEARELWRRRIKYELLVQRVEGASDAETRARVIRRFDAFRQRMQETDDDELLSWYLTSLAMAYDPHRSFLSAKRVEDFENSIRQQLDGIGAQLKSVDGDTLVVQVIPGGPAAGDGRLKAGDKIVGVGQGESGALVDVSGRRLNDVVAQIRGKSGSIVRLQVISQGQTESVTYNLVRQRVQSDEARGTVLERGRKSDGTAFQLGYIRLSNLYTASFQGGQGAARTSTTDVRRLLEDPQTGFKARDVAIVILDLRDNSGGPLSEAISLPGLFIDTGSMMQVKGADGKVEQYDDEKGTAWEGPLVVLTNRQTASGAEIVAAAIQDYGRGLVIGDSATHGNGTVQSMLDIGKLTAPDAPPKLGLLKVTTQLFYRVSGESVQSRGIVADIVLPSATQTLRTGEMYLPGALPPDTADPTRYVKLELVTAEQKTELQARSNQRREGSTEFRQMATVSSPPPPRTSVVLTEEGVREALRRTAAPEPPPATTAVFRPTFDNQEIVSIALDTLHLQLVARGKAAFAKGNHSEAVSAYREAVQLDPQAAEVHYYLAWVLATCPEKKVRNGRRAVEAAQAACTLSENKVWRYLLALAAAHAEAGDFASAKTSLQKMLDLAPPADGAKYRYLLDRFANGQAF